jgi:hypothetical protein
VYARNKPSDPFSHHLISANPCRMSTSAKSRIYFKTNAFNPIRINTYRFLFASQKTKDFNSCITASYAIFPRNPTGINTSAKGRFFCISRVLLTRISPPETSAPCLPSPSPRIPELVAPLFSSTYKLLFSQLPCLYSLTNCPPRVGVQPTLRVKSPADFPTSGPPGFSASHFRGRRAADSLPQGFAPRPQPICRLRLPRPVRENYFPRLNRG